MNLIGNVRILFGDQTIIEQTLEEDRRKWHGLAVMPEIHPVSNDLLLLKSLLYRTPLTIVGDKEQGLVLAASLKRFPYSINSRLNFSSFGLQLVPKQGIVQSVDSDVNDGIAINTLSMNPSRILIDLGNKMLRLEVFFQETEQIDEIQPPAGFQETIILPERSYTQ